MSDEERPLTVRDLYRASPGAQSALHEPLIRKLDEQLEALRQGLYVPSMVRAVSTAVFCLKLREQTDKWVVRLVSAAAKGLAVELSSTADDLTSKRVTFHWSPVSNHLRIEKFNLAGEVTATQTTPLISDDPGAMITAAYAVVAWLSGRKGENYARDTRTNAAAPSLPEPAAKAAGRQEETGGEHQETNRERDAEGPSQ